MKPLSVSDLVPHSQPMILIDTVDSYRSDGLTATVIINEQSQFLEERGVPTWVGLEYMGQTIAAFAGASAREQGLPVKIGFLVSARRYHPSISYFPKGSRLQIQVDAVTTNTTGLRVFECKIACDGEEVVAANLNVYMPENISDFMEEQL